MEVATENIDNNQQKPKEQNSSHTNMQLGWHRQWML